MAKDEAMKLLAGYHSGSVSRPEDKLKIEQLDNKLLSLEKKNKDLEALLAKGGGSGGGGGSSSGSGGGSGTGTGGGGSG